MEIESTKLIPERLPHKAMFKINEIDLVLGAAFSLDYIISKIDYNTGLIRLDNGSCQVNLYTTTFTVSTEIYHPKKGKTQLHRKNLSYKQVIEILKKPRIHTGKGYYTKNK